ncbi:MAG: peptidoglycan-associated lipoprotein Pal [Deltaproteobacteria bacterium]|nr:peptidoglycan-associated lipoprotein Pal [Deltaproteobacteria bacterium]
MLKNFLKGLLFLMAISALLLTTACAKKELKTDTGAAPAEETQVTQQQPAGKTDGAANLEEEDLYGKTLEEARINFMNEDIHFEFDSYRLVPEYVTILQTKVRWLASHPNIAMIIEGHCDDRGTEAYNLSLGERRASAVKQFLLDAGVDASRMEIVSYGEEKPLDSVANDVAWAKNRRAHFSLK